MTNKASFPVGVVFMLLSATGMAFTGLFGKIGVAYFWLVPLIFWRFLAATLVCLAFLLLMGQLKGSVGDIKMHLLRAACILSAQFSFYYYIKSNSLLNGLVLLNTGPLFIPIIEKIAMGNKIGKSTWIGIAISFVGILCILQPEREIFSWVGLIGLFAGLSQGASQVVFGINSKAERSDLSVFYLFVICAIITLVPYLFEQQTFITPNKMGAWPWLLVLLLGVASVANQLCRAVAYQHGTPSRLSTFMYFSVLLAGFLDWIVFRETPNNLAIIGAVLVVLGGMAKIYFRARTLKKR